MDTQTMTVEEAAEVLQISRKSAYLAARRGELPIIRIGRRLLVSRPALDRMIQDAGKSTNSGK